MQDVTACGVPRHLLAETESQLRKAGLAGYEMFALWSGSVVEKKFIVKTLHVPPQTAFKLDAGLCVRVDGSALHSLNRWLYEHQEILGVQIHTHPTEAYHSETDDAYPIVTSLGGLSIVVPDFCERGIFGDGTVGYRLQRLSWRRVPDRIFAGLLEVG